ncbi:BREX-1 system adenine-specific DNA-methyltransferase PglX [Dietzia kunjamensis]|uniref:BREX-1 system adenine-specific DNA-methyltransferase PglX n=1 Tax=Dietzia kunjamensis TaxID=322509 RepID=UPI0039BC7539
METAPLKGFAAWARTALIREVAARMAAVLAPGSSERVEQGRVVAALEKSVRGAGGGDRGRAAVAERVAYTWFNRIIALRFMDASGYTGIGVVSPQAGIEVGQPEVLAEAKRGVIDVEVVSDATRRTVTALLNGTRASDDPQGEAYALLLTAYCRYWNATMPFMFEREGDYTELLIPANLLADDSVLNRSVKVLTEDVCKDVEVIGWLYQFYISERKDEVFAGFKKNKKAAAEEIPAATQLFTPHWIVRYLVENSLGRIWMLNRPNSGLVGQMDYYISPVDEETDFLKIASPEELTVIDPACGSGHMLTYAFDLLYAIYEEEGYSPGEIPGLILTHNLYGTEIDPRAGALAAFALTMKARARQRTFFNKRVEPNICVIEAISFTPYELDYLVTTDGDRHAEESFWNQFAEADILGSLIKPDPDITIRLAIHLETLDDDGDMLNADVLRRAQRVATQAELLTPRYSVVVANPPYMGGKNMGPRLAEFAKSSYPLSKADLFAMFIERCCSLTMTCGLVGMITMQSWMFLDSFQKLRSRLLKDFPLSTMAHLGARAFDTITGEVVSTTAFVLEAGGDSGRGARFVRLVDLVGELAKAEGYRSALLGDPDGRSFTVSSQGLSVLPQSVVAYSMPEATRALFRARRIGDVAHVHRGISTGNNGRYMRSWFEVPWSSIKIDATSGTETAGHRWYPVNRGSYPMRWYGYGPEVLDYQDSGVRMRDAAESGDNPGFRHDGAAEYFKETITWSAMTSGAPLFRLLPHGFVIGHKGPGIAVPADRRPWMLALLNSTPAARILRQLSGTLDILVGQIQQLPLPEDDGRERIEQLVSQLIGFNRSRFAEAEDSIEFVRHPLIRDPGTSLRLMDAMADLRQSHDTDWKAALAAEDEIDAIFFDVFGLERGEEQVALDEPADCVDIQSLISFAVGCMFGRYSLDETGLILADQGATLQDYLAKVPSPTFMPDADNVIPIVDGDWFEDDIVERFRQFLRVAFGEQHFEQNLRFVTESLGVKHLRDYFVKSFYMDHVRRYKKRPIYWLFSSSKGSFNALIYLHRYTPSTASTVLNEYLREFQAKLKASLEHAERSNNAKEADRLRKILLELDDYEHDVLYPLASQNITIDLHDGVKTNYPKFGAALKKIPGLEAAK